MPKKSKETLPETAAGGEQFVKVAQADDTNPDAREASPEEMEAMLQGKNRTHFEGLGDAWAVLTGQNPAAVMPQVVGTVLHEGGTRPSWQWKRGGRDHVLMAWPKDQPVRASVLVAGEQGGKLTPVSVVPLLDGLPNDLTVEEVHPWESGLGANVAVSMVEGKNPMWFFDPLYGRDHDDLTPGITHTFLLAGLAYGLRKALLDAGLERVPIVSFSTSIQEGAPGISLTGKMLRRMIMAGHYGDALLRMIHRVRPYEREAGSAEALAALWTEKAKKNIVSRVLS